MRSQGLLKELIAYDGDINTDRAMAFMILQYYILELRKYKVDIQTDIKGVEDSDFFNKPQFYKKPVVYR